MAERNELRRLFTDVVIEDALLEADGIYSLAARILTEESGHLVKPNNVHGWIQTIRREGPRITGPDKVSNPKVLIFDIETAPLKQYIWSLWQKFHGLDMNISEWFILSYSAKWLDAPDDEIYYQDLRGTVGTEDDTDVLRGIWKLLDEADAVITQNGNRFDIKKLNARFLMKGFDKPSPYKRIDTLIIAKREFGFTSNKLEWMTDKINEKYKKLKHGKFPGFELWKECLDDNIEAWSEMEEYNKYDVLSLEELYMTIRGWDSKHPNFALYTDDDVAQCNVCQSTDLQKDGYAYTNLSKFQQHKCNNCGQTLRSRTNLLSKEKRATLRMNVGQ